MNGLDLSRFQFDYDQTWAVMFFRHDGTLLARYGTRGDQDGMKYNSLEGFTATMQTALNVNANWRSEWQPFYDAKRGPASTYATVDQIPSAAIRKTLAREADGKQSCIHCHNVYDAKRDVDLANGNYDPAKRYKYPLPENIGLELDEVARVKRVLPNSPAATSGLSAADRIHRINGQNVHSIADIQFALHHISDPGEVIIETLPTQGNNPGTASAKKTRTLSLPAGWRVGDIGWRASMYGMPPKPGLWIQALTDKEKSTNAIAQDKLALKVRGLFGNDVRNSDLEKDDIIVQFGTESRHHAEGDFHAHLRLNYYQPDSKLKLRVLRKGESKEVVVTFVNP